MYLLQFKHFLINDKHLMTISKLRLSLKSFSSVLVALLYLICSVSNFVPFVTANIYGAIIHTHTVYQPSPG